MYFLTEEKVLSYDCDLRNRMKISAAMRYMQQVAAESLWGTNSSAEALRKRDMVFLLSKICLKVHRIPKLHEDIVLGTAPTHTKGVRYVREFIIESKDGERLISAVSYWPLIEISTRKVLRPNKHESDLVFQPVAITDYIDDVSFPKDLGEGEHLYDEYIKYSTLDINRHVNNAVYGDIICDAMPYKLMSEGDIDTFVIGFQNEAVIDDLISVKRYPVMDSDGGSSSEKSFYVTGDHERAECFRGLVRFK
jgi:acyl-ACP thioesterase